MKTNKNIRRMDRSIEQLAEIAPSAIASLKSKILRQRAEVLRRPAIRQERHIRRN